MVAKNPHTHTQSTTPTILCRQSSLIQLRVRSSDNGQAHFNSILLHNFYSLSDKLIIRCNRRSCNEVDGMMDSIKMTFCNELFRVTTTTLMVAASLTWKWVNRFHRFLRNGDKIYFLDWIDYLAHKSCKSITYYKFYIYANSLQNIGHRNGEWNRWYDISCLSLPKWLFGHTTFAHLHISLLE